MNPIQTKEVAKPQAGPKMASAHSRWEKVRDGLLALSLANLCFIGAWFPVMYDQNQGYFNHLRLTVPTLLAVLVNLTCSSTAIWFILRALRRVHCQWVHLVAHLCLVAMLLIPVDFYRLHVFLIPGYTMVTFLRRPAVISALAILLPLLLWQHRRVAQALAIASGLLSPLAFLVLGRIAMLVLGLQHIAQHDHDPVLPALSPVHPGQPRVLWILFDETDQRLAFDERPAALRLPHFDQLRAEGLYATNAYPPCGETLLSLPALISGQIPTQAIIKSDSDLWLKLAGTGTTNAWSELPSVFTSARELGVNTAALLGWYHPYDRVLGNGLNYCYWYPHPMFEPARAPTFWAALGREVGCLASVWHERQLFIDLCRDGLTRSVALVTNENYGLIFLHLPPPHSPGVYLPEQDRFTSLGLPGAKAYFNNLVLADRWLGRLRTALERSAQWDGTWLMMSSDHSWRSAKSYDGRRDLRVPFLVKSPGPAQPTTYAPRFNTVLSHNLVISILRGQITNQASLVTWLDTHRTTESPQAAKRERP